MFALLAGYVVSAWTAALFQGLSFDEGLQIAVGAHQWQRADFRMEGGNGDLIKRWATLPLLVSRPQLVTPTHPAWKSGNAYELGRVFLFELDNRPDEILWQTRAMIALLGGWTGWLVYRRAREAFGKPGALVALGLFAASPTMLAFGGVVSTDMSITLALFGCTHAVWRLLHRITVGHILAGLGWSALLVLAKASSLAVLPIAGLLVAFRLWTGRPLRIHLPGRRWTLRSRGSQAGIFLLLFVLHAGAGVGALWAHYQFRFEARGDASDPTLRFNEPFTRDEVPKPLVSLVGSLQQHRLLPDGFLRGIEALLSCDDGLGSFVAGTWRLNGHWTFFPFTIWAKTPPGVFALLLVGAGMMWPRRRTRARVLWGRAHALVPSAALVIGYLALALGEDINIGHRHVLPIYPAIYVLAGAAGLAWGRPGRTWRIAVVLLATGSAAGTAAVAPHCLAYFGPQAGGPANGYRQLVDSSLDWGMSLPALRRWLDEHNPGGRQPVFLGYFGSDLPSYHGIRATRLPGFRPRRTFERYTVRPGYYAISASLLQGVYTAAFGPWNAGYERLYQEKLANARTFDRLAADPATRQALFQSVPSHVWMDDFDLFDNLRFARLCAWLRRHGPPPEHAGYSILIWKLSQAQLEAALLAGPPELADGPLVIRRFRKFVAEAGSTLTVPR